MVKECYETVLGKNTFKQAHFFYACLQLNSLAKLHFVAHFGKTNDKNRILSAFELQFRIFINKL